MSSLNHLNRTYPTSCSDSCSVSNFYLYYHHSADDGRGLFLAVYTDGGSMWQTDGLPHCVDHCGPTG
eukprot:COSAG06_NODE_5_length_38423_cov_121.612645_14_plen_67_part_00